MKNQILIIFLFGALAASLECIAQKKGDSLKEVKAAIAKSNTLYFTAFTTGDSSIFIGRYATDCCIMPPNMPAMCDPTSPLDFFRMAYGKLGIRGGNFTTISVFGDGKEFVTEEGLFQLFDSRNVLIDNGKYLVLWKKTSHGWKMFRDSFSSNGPKK